MRIYLTGPRRGESYQFDTRVAEVAAGLLREKGHQVAQPASWNHTTLRQDVTQLLDSEAVALLPGWQGSPTAYLEVELAERLELSCRPVDGFLFGEQDGPDELPTGGTA